MIVTVGKNKAKPLTAKEILCWGEFINERALSMHDQQRDMVCKLYAKVFKIPYLEVSKEQDQRPLLKMIDKLDQVFESNNNN
jgi:hypothetical protein